MLKIILKIFIGVSVLTIIGALIPQQITASINSSIIYFLSFINYLDIVIPAEAIFISIKILFNFFVSIALMYMIKFLVTHFT